MEHTGIAGHLCLAGLSRMTLNKLFDPDKINHRKRLKQQDGEKMVKPAVTILIINDICSFFLPIFNLNFKETNPENYYEQYSKNETQT
jgi:hypothetical protein